MSLIGSILLLEFGLNIPKGHASIKKKLFQWLVYRQPGFFGVEQAIAKAQLQQLVQLNFWPLGVLIQ
ncbi:hypothetical protein [Vibrio harveyi]|uniref:hypothetical protein n=1 Tax=Vibrio harveyi TaxID=669 RepID=UPI00217EABEB|nr:hypothetical protein [Vibrio harveyi]HEQ3589570.1 hypothetical protein [Vibrio harveyi]HEQ3599447.1 hypothetical protein [Vibrio harveyi]HEQ3610144.1 hypothetical protein [Vibrio harveyi]